jgi:hypothetical protein
MAGVGREKPDDRGSKFMEKLPLAELCRPQIKHHIFFAVSV